MLSYARHAKTPVVLVVSLPPAGQSRGKAFRMRFAYDRNEILSERTLKLHKC